MYSHDIIIIGGGAAGLTAASGMAQLGMKVALIEKEHMGGDCLYYGCIPSKSLLKAARVRELSRRSTDFGLSPMDLPPVNADSLMKRIRELITRLEPNDSPERFRSLGCQVYLQGARFVSSHEVELYDGTRLSAKNLIISTGSSPRIPPIPGLKETKVWTNKDIFQLKELPKSLVVLGAGPIGVEMSQAMSRLGVKVLLVDKAPHILPREDPDMSEIVERQLNKEGILLQLGADILNIQEHKDKKSVRINRSGKEETLEAEKILVALGRQGNIEDLDLEKAGILNESGFIPVDSKLRTNCKHILALGDVNGKYLFTHTAGAEGSYAVRRLGLRLPGKFSYKNTPWSTYTDPEISSVGYNEIQTKKEGIKYRIYIQDLSDVDRAQAEGETEGRIKILTDRRDRILGVQIVGSHAGELLTPALYAVKRKWKLMELLGPVVPYPTMGEVYKKLAGSAAAPRLFNPEVRKFLHLLYRYRGRRD